MTKEENREYNWLNQKRADNEVKKFIVCSFLLLLEEEEADMSESGKKGFFDGRFGKYLLPGILLQSVLIGGGYAT